MKSIEKGEIKKVRCISLINRLNDFPDRQFVFSFQTRNGEFVMSKIFKKRKQKRVLYKALEFGVVIQICNPDEEGSWQSCCCSCSYIVFNLCPIDLLEN